MIPVWQPMGNSLLESESCGSSRVNGAYCTKFLDRQITNPTNPPPAGSSISPGGCQTPALYGLFAPHLTVLTAGKAQQIQTAWGCILKHYGLLHDFQSSAPLPTQAVQTTIGRV